MMLLDLPIDIFLCIFEELQLDADRQCLRYTCRDLQSLLPGPALTAPPPAPVKIDSGRRKRHRPDAIAAIPSRDGPKVPPPKYKTQPQNHATKVSISSSLRDRYKARSTSTVLSVIKTLLTLKPDRKTTTHDTGELPTWSWADADEQVKFLRRLVKDRPVEGKLVCRQCRRLQPYLTMMKDLGPGRGAVRFCTGEGTHGIGGDD